MFDTTNNQFYPQNELLMMRLLHEYQEKGYQVPKLAFFTNTDSGKRTEDIYRAFIPLIFIPIPGFIGMESRSSLGKKKSAALRYRISLLSERPSGPMSPNKSPMHFRGWSLYGLSEFIGMQKVTLR